MDRDDVPEFRLEIVALIPIVGSFGLVFRLPFGSLEAIDLLRRYHIDRDQRSPFGRDSIRLAPPLGPKQVRQESLLGRDTHFVFADIGARARPAGGAIVDHPKHGCRSQGYVLQRLISVLRFRVFLRFRDSVLRSTVGRGRRGLPSFDFLCLHTFVGQFLQV
jgi:hypothetical protein